MFKNGLLGAFILFPLFVSCGKNDVLKKAKDFTDELATNSREFIDGGIHNIAYGVGKTGEQIGQVPRIIGNKLLGTDADTDENLHDLEKRVDELYQQFLSNYTKLLGDISTVKIDLISASEDTTDLIDALNTALDDLNTKVDSTNNNSTQELQELNIDVLELVSIVNCVSNAKNFKKAQDVCF